MSELDFITRNALMEDIELYYPELYKYVMRISDSINDGRYIIDILIEITGFKDPIVNYDRIFRHIQRNEFKHNLWIL